MKKPNTVYFISITVFFAVFVLFSLRPDVRAGVPARGAGPENDKAYESTALLMNVVHILRESYVDSDKVSYEKLIRGALKGMLKELDPYSIYETPEHYKNTMEQTRGSFGGLGVVVTTRNKVLEVVMPMEDTPGFKAGLHPGDIITEIEGETTRGKSLLECVKLLKGRPGTEVSLKVFRRSEGKTKNFTIERAVIKVSPVPANSVKIIENGIGYIRIKQFSAPTAAELDKALAGLGKKGLKALIIDLRNNPGGLLYSAVEVCSRFLEKGSLVVFTSGRTKADRKDYNALPSVKLLDIPMAILVNGNSASAAEIVAGCLKDHKRAVLIGERTFGKGSVQTIIPLDKNGAVRFTTAKYYTPSEQVIHEKGIMPDIEVDIPEKDEIRLAHQAVRYPGTVKPGIKGTVRDRQLERAVEILKGVCLFSQASRDD